MPTSSLPDYAFAGGSADGFAGRGWRMWRPAVIVSILAHVAVLYGASRLYATGSLPTPATFEWLAVFEAPITPSVQPSLDVAAPVPPVIAPVAPPRTLAPRAVSPPVVVPPEPEAPVETPTAPVGPSRFDLDVARRAAAAAVVEQRARGSTLLQASILDAPPPR